MCATFKNICTNFLISRKTRKQTVLCEQSKGVLILPLHHGLRTVIT